MRTSLAKFWGFTSLATIAIIGTTNFNVSFAGGDPSIKDKKVYQSKSNIKQHNHDEIYKTKNKSKTLKKDENVKESKISDKNQESTVSGFRTLMPRICKTVFENPPGPPGFSPSAFDPPPNAQVNHRPCGRAGNSLEWLE